MGNSNFSIASLHDRPDDKGYWSTKTPQERLEALELLRQIVFGYDATTARIQRVVEVVPLAVKQRTRTQPEFSLMHALQPVLLTLRPDHSQPIPARVAHQRSAARHALARCAAMCGAPLEGWQQTASGAPLPNQGFHWSISHKPLLVGAVVSNQPVGIDIEHIKPRGNEGLWERVADADEWSIVGQRSWEAFFRLWTAKEATLKANGRGIGGLAECRIVFIPAENHLVMTYHGREWQVEQLYHQDHVIALTTGGCAVRWQTELS